MKVLATTTFTDQAASWIGGISFLLFGKRHGKGRVFYSSLGHVIADFNVPEALEITKRHTLGIFEQIRTNGTLASAGL